MLSRRISVRFVDFLFMLNATLTATYKSQTIPLVLSDVTPADFTKTISSLLSATFFPPNSTISSGSVAHLRQMVTRWQRYLNEGIVRLATNIDNGQKMTEFWTGPWPYWNMNELAPE